MFYLEQRFKHILSIEWFWNDNMISNQDKCYLLVFRNNHGILGLNRGGNILRKQQAKVTKFTKRQESKFCLLYA